MLNDLAARGRKALDRYNAADSEWQSAVLDLALWLAEAKALISGNQNFNVWLAENNLLDLGDQDRAALIAMGQHPEETRAVLTITSRKSLRLIWQEEIKPRVDNVVNTTSDQRSSPKIERTPVKRAEMPDSSDEENEKSDEQVIDDVDLEASRSPLRKLPRADTVLAHVLNRNTRRLLGKNARPRKLAIWELLIEAITSGAFGEPSGVHVTKPNLRVILPWVTIGFSDKFNLRKESDRQIVRQIIFPLVQANHEMLRRDPSQLPILVAQATRAHNNHVRDEQIRVKAREQGTEPLVVYGKVLWPQLGSVQGWTREDLLEAFWFFDFLAPQIAQDRGPENRAIQIRQLLRWIKPARGTGWGSALQAICYAYEKAPQESSQIPPPPINHA